MFSDSQVPMVRSELSVTAANCTGVGVLRHLEYTLAELPRHVDSAWEPYLVMALAMRDRLIQRWIQTQDA
jgi:hypothetical protein